MVLLLLLSSKYFNVADEACCSFSFYAEPRQRSATAGDDYRENAKFTAAADGREYFGTENIYRLNIHKLLLITYYIIYITVKNNYGEKMSTDYATIDDMMSL